MNTEYRNTIASGIKCAEVQEYNCQRSLRNTITPWTQLPGTLWDRHSEDLLLWNHWCLHPDSVSEGPLSLKNHLPAGKQGLWEGLTLFTWFSLFWDHREIWPWPVTWMCHLAQSPSKCYERDYRIRRCRK